MTAREQHGDAVADNRSSKMAGLLETWSNVEVRSVIRFLHAKGKKPAEIHRELVEVYGNNVLSRKQVWCWCREFDNGRTDITDEHRSGRPSTSASDQNICQVEGMIREDRRITLSHIAEVLNISYGSVHRIVHNTLGYRKVCAHWVPRNLTETDKNRRMGISLNHLTRYHQEGSSFLYRIITGDETPVPLWTPESKRSSMMWKHPSSPPSKKFKTVTCARKTMATVFWDHLGVIHLEFLPPGTTITARTYCQTLDRLREAIRRKRPGALREGVLLLHDNARPHTAQLTRDHVTRFNWEVLEHPAYSPDLAPSDFHLFGPMKKHLQGQRFNTVQEAQDAVKTWLNSLDTDFFHSGIDALVTRCTKCLDKYGDYVEC